MADVFQDKHYAARGSIERVPHPALGDVAMAAPAPRLSASPGEIKWAGREIGVDTRAVLAEKLGYSAERIDQLIAAAVVVQGGGK